MAVVLVVAFAGIGKLIEKPTADSAKPKTLQEFCRRVPSYDSAAYEACAEAYSLRSFGRSPGEAKAEQEAK